MLIKWIPQKIFYWYLNKLNMADRFPEGIRLLRKRIKYFPDDYDLRYQLAYFHSMNFEYSQAMTILYNLLVEFPNCAENAHRRWVFTNELIGMGKFADALPFLQEAIEYWENNANLRARIGLMYLELGNHKLAEEAFEIALSLDAQDPDSIEGMVRVYSLSDRQDQIEIILKNCLSNSPDSKVCNYLLGEHIWQYKGDANLANTYFSAALATYESESKDFPKYLSQRLFPGNLVEAFIHTLLITGQDNEAKKLNKKYAKEGQNWDSYIAYKTKNVEEAVRLARKNVHKNPDKPEYYFELGKYSLFAKDYNLAEKVLDRAYQMILGQDEVWVRVQHYALLIVLYTITGAKIAGELAKKALKLDALNTWITLASLYSEMEEWDKTIDAAKEALKSFPKRYDALLAQGRAQAGLGLYKDALKNYEIILQQQPQNGEAWLDVAQIYQELEQHVSTLNAVEKALSTRNLSTFSRAKAESLHTKLRI